MPDRSALEHTLTTLDGRGYAGYKQLRGTHELPPGDAETTGLRLLVDHVQVDPYAPPSLMRVQLDRDAADLPEDLTADARGRTAVADFLTRRVAEAARRLSPGRPGDGSISIDDPASRCWNAPAW
nr:ABC-ATPase domain-containing protein [Nesterenkonia sp. PF2B19]